jgi:hypothetical protein
LGWEARVDSGVATSKENETRGVLSASLTVEGVSVAKADGTPVRWTGGNKGVRGCRCSTKTANGTAHRRAH